MTPRGYVLHEDADRVAIVTLTSANAKTGNMAQVWILVRKTDPLSAVKRGKDSLVCGDCVHRPKNLGTCYVNLFRSPLAVWRAYRRGIYPRLDAHGMRLLRGRSIRLGAYGDPAFVPAEIWSKLRAVAGSVTGYTHQWRTQGAVNPGYREALMASVDSPEEQREARALGWRTFHVLAEGEERKRDEVTCPASEEAGYARTCETCGACDGSRGLADKRASIAIAVHGAQKKKFLPLYREATP